MKIKLSDNKVISLLLVALVAQVLLLLWHMDILHFHGSSQQANQGLLAGKIDNIENLTKRRPLDSLIWEESRAPEQVYFYDSILTLAESSAKIKLNNGTQIQLAENTLITIEPEEKDQSNEIRIQFNQGHLKARNPYESTTIKDENLVMVVNKESDIDISKNESGQVEIYLNKGSAQIDTENKKIQIKQNEILLLDKGKIERQKIAEQLSWLTEPLVRTYTHTEKAITQLSWQGEARQLIIKKNGKQFKNVPVHSQQRKIKVKLPLGSYSLYLGQNNTRTKPIELQVWKAPVVQLVYPLPRNTMKSGATEFVWTPHQDIASYQLRLKSVDKDWRFDSELNKTQQNITVEGDYQWSVWGVDQKGFSIPPAYSYPLFIRYNPFAPPKLHRPQKLKNQEKIKTSWWLPFIFPTASADNNSLALFTWDNVPGAEIYFIEISKTKDFRSPVVKQQVAKNQFIWSDFDESETYYWRVAAGDNSGRLGVFSPATVVDLEAIKISPKVAAQKQKSKKPTTVARRTLAPLPKPKPKPKPEPEPVSSTSVRPTSKPRLEAIGNNKNQKPKPRIKSIHLFLMPSYGLKKYTFEGNTKAQLKGFNLLSLGLDLKINLNQDKYLSFYSKFSQVTYKPKPKDLYPFQGDLTSKQWISHFKWHNVNSYWSYGLSLMNQPFIKRQSYEQVRIEQKWGLGPVISYRFLNDHLISNLAPLFYSNASYGAYTSHRLLYPVYGAHLRVGAELEATYLFSKDGHRLMTDLYFILGWKF